MRNINNRPHEPSSSKFLRVDKETNYATTRKKLKGSPIPIPQGPSHDCSSKIISRMKRKDDLIQSSPKTIPTRFSNRLSPRKKKEEEVIEINSDEEKEENNRPTLRKRRMIQRDYDSDEDEQEKKLEENRLRMANKLRRERLEKEEKERKLQENKKLVQVKQVERIQNKPDLNKFQSDILPSGKKKDFTPVQRLIEDLSSSGYKSYYEKQNIDFTGSYIEKQKTSAKADLIKKLGVTSQAEPSTFSSIDSNRSTARRSLLKTRDPYKESKKELLLKPYITVSKPTSVFDLPLTKAETIATTSAATTTINEDDEYDIEMEPIEDVPELEYDPIDDEPVKPIGGDRHLLTYPFQGKKSVTIYERDLERLEQDQFLNDSLLDIFPKIWADEYPHSSTHTYSSFFYTKLAGDGSSVNYDKIGRWTANINIFEKKLIIIPIAQNHHWYLVVVTNPGYCIKNPNQYGLNITHDEDEGEEEYVKLPNRPGRKAKNLKAGAILDRKKPYIMILDALGGSKYETCKNTSEYLKKEAMQKLNIKEEDFMEPEFVYTDCPNQKNFVDCGVFCLHYMKSLYQDTERMMDVLYNNLKGDKGWDIENTLPNFRLILKRILKKKMVQYRDYLRKTIENEA